MFPFQLLAELSNSGCKNPDTPEFAHIGSDKGRIKPLFRGINTKRFNKGVGQSLKKNMVKSLVDEYLAIGAERSFRYIVLASDSSVMSSA